MSCKRAASRYFPAIFMLAMGLQAAASAQWSLDHLSLARSGAVAAVVGDKVVIAGGRDPNMPLDRVDILDLATGVWTVDKLPVARPGIAVAASDGKVYLAGGRVSGMTPDLTRVDIYDVASGTWSLTHLPVGAELMAGAAIGGKVFFAGGTTSNGPLSIVQVHHPASGLWTTKDVLGTTRWSIAVAKHADRVYFVGGTGGPKAGRTVTVFDDPSDSWFELEKMPFEHDGAAVAIVDRKLLVAGGCGAQRIVDIYDLDAGGWTTKHLPEERCSLAGVGLGPYGIFVGGAPLSGVLHSTADIYNSLTDEWTTLDVSTDVIDRAAAAVPEGNLALFAGGRGPLGNRVDNVDIFHYEDDLGDRYCSPANLNSSGFSAALSAVGVKVAADSFLTLVAQGMTRNQPGYFLVGSNQAFVPHPGGSQGNLCIGGQVGRYAKSLATTGTQGRFAVSIDLRALPTSGPHDVMAGETWNFQAWFRDEDPGPTSNFTDGISILFE